MTIVKSGPADMVAVAEMKADMLHHVETRMEENMVAVTEVETAIATMVAAVTDAEITTPEDLAMTMTVVAEMMVAAVMEKKVVMTRKPMN